MKSPGATAILLLLFLRLAAGSHFFSEGLTKLRSGGFSAEPFLRAATGPAAPFLQRMLDDPDHARLLCIRRIPDPPGEDRFETDPELTIAIWNDHADRCVARCQAAGPPRVGEPGQLALSSQQRELLVRALVRSHCDELRAWLDAHRTELIAHFSTAARATAFERDGAAGPRIAAEVASLREQKEQIRRERKQQADGWAREVSAMWDSLETALQAVMPGEPSQPAARLPVHRPHDQPHSWLKWVNSVIPWFDLLVGILLLLGLFSRGAALAGAALLLAVIATQPPWIPGAAPVWYQLVEFAALLVLASRLARQIPGLDWLIPWPRRRRAARVPTSSAT